MCRIQTADNCLKLPDVWSQTMVSFFTLRLLYEHLPLLDLFPEAASNSGGIAIGIRGLIGRSLISRSKIEQLGPEQTW